MFDKLFWRDALERALKTFAQAVLAVIGVAATTPVTGFDWPTILLTGATAAVISLLTSFVSVGSSNTVSPASLVKRGF
ncbi:MAG TPA: holin [Pyrinomonadaceae bacterium]